MIHPAEPGDAPVLALPEIVQIDILYTPPGRRGQALTRSAVALHLHEARLAGVGRAVLFASGPAACRAHEALGFTRVGRYTPLFFACRKEIAACP